MPVSGLVLTLSAEPGQDDRALRALAGHPMIDIGDRQGPRLPIVVDSPTDEEDKAVWEWLHQCPGVLFVDLVYTDQSADAATDATNDQLPDPHSEHPGKQDRIRERPGHERAPRPVDHDTPKACERSP